MTTLPHMSSGTVWLHTADHAALCDPQRGILRAVIWHDGYGKYHPTLFVSPVAALRLQWRNRFDGGIVSVTALRWLSRVAVSLVRTKDGIADAQQWVERLLAL